MQTQFRYSASGFQTTVLAAAGLTCLVTFLVWLFSRLAGFQNANTITFVSGMIFFAFCSAAMIWRYMRSDVVMAVQPGGLYDIRTTPRHTPWEQVRMIGIVRHESDYRLKVYLWPPYQGVSFTADLVPDYILDLAPLEAAAEHVIVALQTHFDRERIIMEKHI